MRNSEIKENIARVYKRYIRNKLPNSYVKYGGYRIPIKRALIDKWVPGHPNNPDRPTYESGILKYISGTVAEGNNVVVVGGGYGVTAVAAAKRVGRRGNVIVYEGSSEFYKKVKDTAKINNVSDNVTVKHAVVGEEMVLRGERGEPDVTRPSEIPKCDVLELDCEGSELDIIDKMKVRPKYIIVETHGMYGSDPKSVSKKLASTSYQVVESSVADASKKQLCKSKGIYVLCAKHV